MTLAYRAFLACSWVVAAIAVTFFFIGVADGSVSSFNIVLWFLMLAFLGVVIWAGQQLRKRDKTGLAVAVLSVVAVPGIFGGLLVLLVLILQPRWN